MKKRFIKQLFLIFFMFNMTNFCHAFDLDETVDDEIRKNYNTQDENLPALPSIIKYGDSTQKSDVKSNNTITPTKNITYTGGSIKIKKGTSFNVSNTSAISDWQSRGTKIKFKTRAPLYGKNYTIPASTTFTGEIVESHQPQITCNGGLVAIKVYSMSYKGQTIPVNAYITRANDKKIFLNNIKGERKYIKTVWKKGDWGRTLFNRMLSLTVSLGGEGSTFILSPFPLAYGTICLGANAITSPICAFFAKGGHVSIASGKYFRIKLLDDIFID